MMTADSHVVSNEIAVSEEMVMLDQCVTTEVGPDSRRDLLPTLCALTGGTGCMVHHVFGYQLIDGGVVA
jgi:hypothetical protein